MSNTRRYISEFIYMQAVNIRIFVPGCGVAKWTPLGMPLFFLCPLYRPTRAFHCLCSPYTFLGHPTIPQSTACQRAPHHKQCRTPRESPSSEVSLCSNSNYWVSVEGCFVGGWLLIRWYNHHYLMENAFYPLRRIYEDAVG